MRNPNSRTILPFRVELSATPPTKHRVCALLFFFRRPMKSNAIRSRSSWTALRLQPNHFKEGAQEASDFALLLDLPSRAKAVWFVLIFRLSVVSGALPRCPEDHRRLQYGEEVSRSQSTFKSSRGPDIISRCASEGAHCLLHAARPITFPQQFQSPYMWLETREYTAPRLSISAKP